MAQKLYEDVEVNYCPDKHGIWVPMDGLKSIVEKKIEIVKGAWKEGERKSGFFEYGTRIKCPVCGAQCEELNYAYSSGVFIDRCPNEHGTWLDENEIEKIQDFIEIWDKSAPEIVKKLKLDEVNETDFKETDLTSNRLTRRAIFWLVVLFIGAIIGIIFRVFLQK